MRHTLIKRLAALVVILAVASLAVLARVNNAPPTEEQKQTAEQTADLLQAEVFAALLQEFGETSPRTSSRASRPFRSSSTTRTATYGS